MARAVLDCTGELAPLVSRGKDGLLNFLLPKNTGTGTLVRPRPILDFLGIHRFGRSFQFMYQNIRVRRDGRRRPSHGRPLRQSYRLLNDTLALLREGRPRQMRVGLGQQLGGSSISCFLPEDLVRRGAAIVQQRHLLQKHRLLHLQVDADFLWRHPSLHEHGLRHVRLLYWWSDAVLPFAPDAIHELAVRFRRRAVGRGRAHDCCV